MKKLLIVLLPFVLIACDSIGSRKVKNIRELTPFLTVESSEKIVVNTAMDSPFDANTSKLKAYNISKNRIISEPVFAKGVTYSVDRLGFVTAFSNKEKRILWSQNVAGKARDRNFSGGGIVYNNEKLFVTNGSRFLVILNSQTGYELGRREFPDIIRTRPILLAEQIVLVQTVSNQLYAYDLANSKLVWQHEGVVETLASSKHVSPIVQGGQVIASYSSGQIFALDSKTGEEKWGINLSTQQDVSLPSFDASTVPCPPIIDGNNIYIASSTNKLLKLDLASGNIIWEVDASDIQSMSLNGNNLFATNNAKQIVAFSTTDGKVKWVADLDLQVDKRKSKSAAFVAPFVLKKEGGWILNVVTNMGEIYSYIGDNNGNLSTQPVIIHTIKNIQYSGATCCGKLYLIGEKQAVFFGE